MQTKHERNLCLASAKTCTSCKRQPFCKIGLFTEKKQTSIRRSRSILLIMRKSCPFTPFSLRILKKFRKNKTEKTRKCGRRVPRMRNIAASKILISPIVWELLYELKLERNGIWFFQTKEWRAQWELPRSFQSSEGFWKQIDRCWNKWKRCQAGRCSGLLDCLYGWYNRQQKLWWPVPQYLWNGYIIRNRRSWCLQN